MPVLLLENAKNFAESTARVAAQHQRRTGFSHCTARHASLFSFSKYTDSTRYSVIIMTKYLIGAVAGALALAGCTTTPTDSNSTPSASAPAAVALAGTKWKIVSIAGAPTGGEGDVRPATMQFEQGNISATAGCNLMNGSYTQEGATLTFGPVAMTRMACPAPGLAERETRLGQMLGQPLTVTADDAGKVMLANADGTVIELAPAQ